MSLNKEKLGIIIQARTGSTRLPNKMLMSFYNKKTILDLLLTRMKELQMDIPIVVATSTNSRDEMIVDIAKRNKVNSFCGSERDVLQRFIDAAETYGFDRIIRICADNPFLSMNYLLDLIVYSKKSDKDYISFQTSKGIPSIKTHFGFWAECIKLEALKRIKEETNEILYHEHVTNYSYIHPEKFSLDFIRIDSFIETSGIRLTVDTESDFYNAMKLYINLVKLNLPIEPENIIPLIDDEMKESMKIQIDANSK